MEEKIETKNEIQNETTQETNEPETISSEPAETPEPEEVGEGEPPKKGFLPKPIRTGILWGGSAILAIAGGFGAGFLIHKMNDNPQVITIDAAALHIDEEALMKTYREANDFGELAPWEMANISLIKFARNEHHRFLTSGSAVAMGLVTQIIRSSGIRDGDEYFEESLSKSEGGLDIQTGWRMYEHADGTSDLYPSKANSISADATRAEWNEGKKETYPDQEAFKAVVGFALSKHLSNYNITEYTFVKEGEEAPSGVGTSCTKSGEGYQLELELDTNLACEDYKIQMQHTSDLYGLPSFSYSHLSFTLTDSLEIVQLKIHEKYKAAISAIISSEVESEITTTYESDGIFAIPSLQENVPYEK